MLSTPVKALLGVLGSIAVVAVVGYATGEFDRFLAPPPQQIAAVPPAAVPEAPSAQTEAQPASANPDAGEPVVKPADPATAPAQTQPTDAPTVAPNTVPAMAGIVPPTFDILRVEPDGSIVIAGKAPAGSKVEVLAGSKVIGEAVAGPEGDFAVVIDQPLAPGSYQIVLRATDETSTVAMSTETAVVSIPERPDGQVLALVEQPGQPSKLITVPEPMTSTPAAAAPAPAPASADEPEVADQPVAAEEKPAVVAVAPEAETPAEAADASAPTENATDAAQAEAGEANPDEEKSAEVALANPEPAKPEEAKPETTAPASDLRVEVRAIEIEGNKVFVAGIATRRKTVRAYANELMLGEARSSETGEFLIEAMIDLPVGDYIVRADLLADDGDKVLMRAQVPFRREAGESIAAVAPEPKPAGEATQPPANQNAPTATAKAPASVAPASEPAASAAKPAAPADVASSASTSQPPAAQGDAQVAVSKPAGGNLDAAVPKPDLAMPTEPPMVTSAPLQAADGAVIIRRGDTLWHISRRVYGRGVRYSTIYLANQTQIADPDRIWPGQVFTVPKKTTEGETADMEAIAGQTTAPDAAADGTAVR